MRRNLLINGALLLCSVTLYFTASELITRVYFFGWSSIHPTILQSIPDVSGDVLPARRVKIFQGSRTEGLTNELIPRNSTFFKKVPVFTNSDGMRDKEYTLKKPKGTYRVAVLGDSITFPDGVPIEQAYHSLLEERWNENHSGMQYEFLNFGVPGYGLEEYLAVMGGKALKYDPDLLLIGFTVRNDHRIGERSSSIPRKDVRSVFLSSVAGGIHRWKQKRGSNISLEAGLRYRWMNQLPDPRKAVPSDEEFDWYADELSAALSAVGAFGRGHHVPIAVVTLDHLPVNGKLIVLLKEHEARKDFSFFDVSQKIPKDAPAPHYTIYRGDPHPNGKVHHAFADALYEYLLESKLIPTG